MNDLYAFEFLKMQKVHHEYMSLIIFRDTISRREIKDLKVKELLNLLGKVFVLHTLSQDSGALYESGYFKPGAN